MATLAHEVLRRCLPNLESLVCTVHKLLLCPAEVHRTVNGVFVEYVLWDASVIVLHKGQAYEGEIGTEYGQPPLVQIKPIKPCRLCNEAPRASHKHIYCRPCSNAKARDGYHRNRKLKAA